MSSPTDTPRRKAAPTADTVANALDLPEHTVTALSDADREAFVDVVDRNATSRRDRQLALRWFDSETSGGESR